MGSAAQYRWEREVGCGSVRPGRTTGRSPMLGLSPSFPTRPLRATQSVQYHQGARGVPGAPERGDRFGGSLGGGGAAIGAPGEDVGSIVDAGTVTWEMTSSMSQNTDGVPGAAERGDQFGAAVSSRTVISFDDEEPAGRDVAPAGDRGPGRGHRHADRRRLGHADVAPARRGSRPWPSSRPPHLQRHNKWRQATGSARPCICPRPDTA